MGESESAYGRTTTTKWTDDEVDGRRSGRSAVCMHGRLFLRKVDGRRRAMTNFKNIDNTLLVRTHYITTRCNAGFLLFAQRSAINAHNVINQRSAERPHPILQSHVLVLFFCLFLFGLREKINNWL